jgi:hypothetical protein
VHHKEKKKVGVVIKKNDGDVITQKLMTSLKQITHHRMAFFKIKSTCPSEIDISNFPFIENVLLYTIVV